MGKRRSIRNEHEYRCALARARELSGVPLGSDDPRAAELDEWLAAIEAYEAEHGGDEVTLAALPRRPNGAGR